MNMIDCASHLDNVSCGTLIQNGITHVGRYLPTSAWKGLTPDEVAAIQNSGLHLVSVFENGGTKPSYFTKDQVIKDAYQAYSLANGLKQPEQTAIYFTVDFDAQTKDFAGILNYFQGLKDTLKSYKVGAYGKFEVIQLLQSKGLANYYWQTYAWSSGQHAKGIHLFQYKNDIQQYGLNLDVDQVENQSCGSWNDVPVSKPESFIMTVKVLNQTDIRDNPDHASGYIKDALKDEVYNVIQLSNDWHQVALDNQTKGWIDGNNGQNLYWLDNPALKQASKTKTYKVQSGQSLTKIAIIFGTSVQTLLTLNPNITNPNKIDVGQTIIIPIN